MKKVVLILLAVLSLNAYGQDSNQVRTLGAVPTDVTTLSKFNVAIPQSGAVGALPASFKFDDECPPVINQCYIGSCVSEATTYGLCGILAKRQNGWNYYDGYNQQDLTHLYSPLFIHFYIKGCSNDCGRCGSSLGAAANFLTNFGAVNLSMWNPNHCDRNACNIQPNMQPNPNNPSAYRLTSAKPLFIPGIRYNPNYKTNAIRYYISQRYPIPIAMDLDRSFMDGSAFNNQTDTWQNFRGQSVGGHAMLIVGYDDIRGAFLVMNSWGTTTWNLGRNDPTDNAKAGFCWISYNIIENYCYEAFVANETQTGYSIPVSDLLSTNNSVRTNPDQKNTVTNKIPFFIVNRYNQYGNVRFIPVEIDKKNSRATIAIYRVNNNEPVFYSAFNTKPNQVDTFDIDGKEFTFKALYIGPWTKHLGIYNGKDALHYQITIK